MSESSAPSSFLARPAVGSTLAVLSGLSFLFLCMILPLVGRAGSAVPYAGKNFISFLLVLLLSLGLSVAACLSKFQRRKTDGSPMPYGSLALCGLLVFLLVALLTGLLAI